MANQQLRPSTVRQLFVALAGVLAVFGLTLYVRYDRLDGLLLIPVIVFLFFLAYRTRIAERDGTVIADERTRSLTRLSAQNGFWIVMISLSIQYLVDLYTETPLLRPPSSSLVYILLGLGAFWLSWLYYRWRGTTS